MFLCISKRAAHGALALFFGAAAVCGVFLATRPRTAAPVAAEVEPEAVPASAHAWGLSFQKDGEPPVPNLSAEELRPYNAFYCGEAGQKRLYLTFDAGYENGNTAPILDALKKHNAPGTFFVVGSYIKENPELIQRMVTEGHAVGNHTYHHPDMSQKDETSFKKELNDLAALFEETTGAKLSPLYRPPEGKFSDENLKWAQELGYKTIFWSLAYVDWKTDAQPSQETAFDKLLPRTHDGAIVLLHSTSATNAAILDALLTRWEEQGYTFGTLAELGESAPASPQAAPPDTQAAA